MADYSGKGVWCVAELRHGKLSGAVFELLTAGRRLADSLKEPLVAVVAGGPGAVQAAQAAASRGADSVLVLEHEALAHFLEDAHASALAGLAARERPRIVLVSASVAGRALAARLAVELKGSLIADAIELSIGADGRLNGTRSAYAGNVLSTVAARRGPEIATVRPLAFPRSGEGPAAPVTPVAADPAWIKARGEFSGFSADESGEIDLSAAEKIVSGGRGLGNPEGFKLVYDLAHALGAAVGASRAVVDAGWIPYKHQVGLTGRAVRPRLYVACGISGQIQHLAGMKSSDVIVAINTDPECPMMKLATFAVVGDVYQLLPALVAEIKRARGS